MIQIAFMTSARKIIRFRIQSKTIVYFDDVWKEGIQVMPKDQNLIERLVRSGKPTLKMMAALIIDSNQGDNLKEYEECKNEEELADMIRKESNSKGLKEVK